MARGASAEQAPSAFARRRRSIFIRVIGVASGAILLLWMVASYSTVVGSQIVGRIVAEARCIEVASTQLLRAAEMSRRVRELQLAVRRSDQLQEAFGLRSALAAWNQAGRDVRQLGETAASDPDLARVDARFLQDVAAVLSRVDAGRRISAQLRRSIDLDAQAYAVVQGEHIDALREREIANRASLEMEQRAYAIVLAVVFFVLALLLVGPALQRAARVLEALAREDEAEKRLATEAAMAAIFEQSRTSVAIIDERGAIVQGNAALATMLGLPTLAARGETLPAYLQSSDALAAYLDGRSHRFEMHLQTATGERWGDASISPAAVLPDGSRTFLLVLEDITVRRALEARLRREAAFDSLTEVENRRALRERVARAFADGRRAYLLLVDLDNFKIVNDRNGHSVGDEVLREVAKRLAETLGEFGSAARMGGDEFAALAFDVSESDLPDLLARIVEAIARPIATTSKMVTVTASVGASNLGHATSVDEETSVDRAFRAADLALYRAKGLGRNRYAIDDARFAGPIEDEPSPAEIREGLARDEFVLLYQPIVDAREGTCVAVEALVRWHRGGREWLGPTAFVAMAERSGTIVPLGSWILERACHDFARMLAAGLPETIDLHINISALQIAQETFVASVRSAITGAGIAPRRVIFEVTEGVLVSFQRDRSSALEEVRAFGVRWCIDDFGSGYSSLAYLDALPIACMKIDGSFVSHDDRDDLANPAIVNVILQLGRTLDIAVIAERVESTRQADSLAEMGCAAIQGFRIARPMDADAFVAFCTRARIESVTTSDAPDRVSHEADSITVRI